MVTDVGQVMSVQPHGEYLILSGSTMVTVWDPDADALVARVEGFEEAVDALAYGDDIIVTEYGSGSVLRLNPGVTRRPHDDCQRSGGTGRSRRPRRRRVRHGPQRFGVADSR